jgi:ABC-2 type transport system ATP-binding protein
MIRIEQLTKRYGDTTVLDIPALEIPEGQIFGLVGNNGAGKTTLFSLFLDLIQATEGTVTINGI